MRVSAVSGGRMRISGDFKPGAQAAGNERISEILSLQDAYAAEYRKQYKEWQGTQEQQPKAACQLRVEPCTGRADGGLAGKQKEDKWRYKQQGEKDLIHECL